MGLTLNYKLRGPVGVTGERARALVAKMRVAALAMKRAGRVEGVSAISSSPGQLAWLSEWLMAPVPGDALDPSVEASYRAAIDRYWPKTSPIARVERFAFYEQARRAFAVVMTGETAKYGNIILKKGVTPVA